MEGQSSPLYRGSGDVSSAVPKPRHVHGFPQTSDLQMRQRLVDAAPFGRCYLSTGQAGEKPSDRSFRPGLPLPNVDSPQSVAVGGRPSPFKIPGRYTDAS